MDGHGRVLPAVQCNANKPNTKKLKKINIKTNKQTKTQKIANKTKKM